MKCANSETSSFERAWGSFQDRPRPLGSVHASASTNATAGANIRTRASCAVIGRGEREGSMFRVVYQLAPARMAPLKASVPVLRPLREDSNLFRDVEIVGAPEPSSS